MWNFDAKVHRRQAGHEVHAGRRHGHVVFRRLRRGPAPAQQGRASLHAHARHPPVAAEAQPLVSFFLLKK